ncbi:AraC family transcriptional regulator [Mycobacterium sp. 141]|uniref:helix-turn-helix domain-containing protein n=1 Tax=Mycobacterium sp. 141 TaxID=1120797 RepID=UPI0003A7B002|nr:AraC family transcriptional regulator [Mycobacterium sp. 141]
MIGFRHSGGSGLDIRVAGMPAFTVVIEFGDNELAVDHRGIRHALNGFVSGTSTGPMWIRSERVECIEVRISPLWASSLLGVAPAELSREVAALEDVWGSGAERLRERLAAATTWTERFEVTNSFLVHQSRSNRVPYPEVVAAWDRIVASRGQVRVGELAAWCGWSRKRLWGRFEAQLGMTPKRAAMLVRFRNAVDGLLSGRPAAGVAAACGYADQAHLCRDVLHFAGFTPATVAVEAVSGLSKRRYEAWGTFLQYGEGPKV